MLKNRLLSFLAGCTLTLGVFAIAQPLPKENIDPARHPNLAAAQRLCREAFDKITAAQGANEFDMEGHAAKAKDLLVEINNQLRMAASAANKNAK